MDPPSEPEIRLTAPSMGILLQDQQPSQQFQQGYIPQGGETGFFAQSSVTRKKISAAVLMQLYCEFRGSVDCTDVDCYVCKDLSTGLLTFAPPCWPSGKASTLKMADLD